MDAEVKETKSIIDPKYRDRTKKADWLSAFLDERVTDAVTREKTKKVENEDGTTSETTETVTLAKRNLNLDSLFGLARANGIDTSAMEAQRDRPNAPGRIRMTLGNSLRAAAKHRHGLFDVNQDWHDADADFIGEAPLTQHRDGTKIAPPKAEAAPAEAAEETATE